MIRPLHTGFPAEAASLATLNQGQEAKVESLCGPAALRRRLMEIGFVPGSMVRFERPTPFGDPLVFSLRGSQIALRRSEAKCIRLALPLSR
jgi:Fe2+ transport system protein FeoA